MPAFLRDTHTHLLVELGLSKAGLDANGIFVVNEDAGDYDFRVESDTNTNAIRLDSGVYGGVGSVGIGAAPAATPLSAVLIDFPALTIPDNTNFASLRIGGTNAKTVSASTTSAIVASLFIVEPNITATGTATDAATVYVQDAPTEGGTGNYALLIDAGTTRLDGRVLIGGPAATVVHDLNTATIVVFNESSADIDFRIESNDNANAFVIDAALNVMGIFSAIQQSTQVSLGGSLTAAAGETASGLVISSSLTMVDTASGALLNIGGTLVEAGTGNHPLATAARFTPPTVTGGGATLTDAATVYISAAPTATVTGGLYSLWVDAGTTRLDGDIDLDSGTGLIRHNVTAGITASTTQTQAGGTALTAEVNEVSTVANANDTVTLPSAVAGYRVVIINNGANTLRIYPASGDNLGAGVDTLTTLTAGSNVVYQAYDATNWESV